MQKPTTTIRVGRFDDHAALAKLMPRYAMEIGPFDQWAHAWKGNPALKHFEGEWPIGWAVEAEDRGLVGYFGNIPSLYQFRGEKIVAAVASTWVVEEAYRNYAIALLKNYVSQPGIRLFINTTAREGPAKVFAAFQFQKVPVADFDKALFWVTNYVGFAERVAKMRLATPILSVVDAAARSLSRSAKDGVRFRERFDDSFEVFWRKLSARSDVLLPVRDLEHLAWHYEYALKEGRAWIVTREAGGELTDYAIFFRQDNPSLGLSRMRLVDFQTLSGDAKVLRNILACAIKRCRDEKLHMIEAVGFDQTKRAMLRSAWPFKRSLECWPFYYLAKDETLKPELARTEAWDPCLYEGDASLW